MFAAIATTHTGALTPADAAMIAQSMLDRASHDEKKRLLQLRDPEGAAAANDDVWKHSREFAKSIPTMEPKDLVLLMVQLAIFGEVYAAAHFTAAPTGLLETAKRTGVDVTAIRAALTKAARAKVKPAKKPTTKAKAK